MTYYEIIYYDSIRGCVCERKREKERKRGEKDLEEFLLSKLPGSLL